MNIKERAYQIASVNMKNKCSPAELEDFAEALVAELAKENKPVVVDHALILAPIQRAADWLKKHGVKIKSLTWHFFGGARIRVENSYKLYMLFSEGRYSQGHTRTGNTRIEHWQARDPVTNVLIEWDEETSC